MIKKFTFILLAAAICFSLFAEKSSEFKINDLILANYEEGAFAYPAKITQLEKDSITVKYEEDNKIETLDKQYIKVFDWKTGMKIQCNWKNEGTYYSGTISSLKFPNLHISYEDGDEEDTTISKCRQKTREVAASTATSNVQEIKLTLKNACSNSVSVREEQAQGGTYVTDISTNASIYRSFNIGDKFTIVSSGASITIQAKDWNAIEIDSNCSQWCIYDSYNAKHCE